MSKDFLNEIEARSRKKSSKAAWSAFEGLVTLGKTVEHFRSALCLLADPKAFHNEADRIAYTKTILDQEHDL